MPSTQQVAARFGCSTEQVKAQYAKNAAQLSKMADQAARTGRKVCNFTETELRERAAKMAALAQ